jgi:3-dehydrosphinganine reductase
VGFSQALRHELKPFGITVSVVCPPNTRTPGFAKENLLKPPEVLKMEEKVPTVDPEIVARAMLRAIPRRTFLINTTPGSRIVYQASRWWPEFAADFFLRRSAKPPSV